MDNAADRKQIRRAEKAAKLADRNRGEVIAALAGTEAGRRYLWDRIAEAGVFESVYSDNPQHMAFNEGKRNGGVALLADFMQFSPDNFILAMREANGRRTQSDATESALRDTDEPATGEYTGSEEPGRVSEAESFPADGQEGRTDH